MSVRPAADLRAKSLAHTRSARLRKAGDNPATGASPVLAQASATNFVLAPASSLRPPFPLIFKIRIMTFP